MANHGVKSLNEIRKKITYTHELISTSFHEAGHTIYGLLHHIKIDMVQIVENKKTKQICGFTYFDCPIIDINKLTDPKLSQKLIKSEICFNYAGLIAEKYHFKNISGSDKFPGFWKNGSSTDTMTAATLIKKYNLSPPGKKRYSFKKNLIKETRQIIKEHWDAVIIISHALFKRKKLSFNDLKNLLIKKMKNKEFWKNIFNNIDYIYKNIDHISEEDLKSILLF